ncbi:hypothetical protein LP419_36805 [Massilia sp. H-1]|nr:hypothetical protein LP419_36805 [Massilia sp. H-1]
MLALDAEGLRLFNTVSGASRLIPFGTARDDAQRVCRRRQGPAARAGRQPRLRRRVRPLAGRTDDLVRGRQIYRLVGRCRQPRPGDRQRAAPRLDPRRTGRRLPRADRPVHAGRRVQQPARWAACWRRAGPTPESPTCGLRHHLPGTLDAQGAHVEVFGVDEGGAVGRFVIACPHLGQVAPQVRFGVAFECREGAQGRAVIGEEEIGDLG